MKWSKVSGYLLEALGIILSILIALAIENWDEAQKKMEKEEIYLQSLHGDLIKDENQLNRRIKDYESKLQASMDIMIACTEPEEGDQEMILKQIESKLTYNFAYIPSNNTYQALESSGDIKFITNSELKILLFELDKAFEANEQKGALFLGFMNSNLWAGFLIEKANYDDAVLQVTDKELKTEVYNRVKRLYKLIETYYYDLLGTELKIEEVRKALEIELLEKEIEFTPSEQADSEAGETKEAKAASAEEKGAQELEDLLDEL